MRYFFVSLLVLSELSLIFSSGKVLHTQLKCWLCDSPCLTATVQNVTSVLADGIPSLGTTKLDTLIIDFLHIDQDGYKADLRNLQIQGLKDSVIEDVSIDMVSKLARFVFHADLTVKSNYITSGTLLTFPIFGAGDYTMSFNNVQIEMIMPFEIIKDAFGNDIMDLKSFQYNYDIKGGARFLFENLYNGDSHLSNIMHDAMHKNWKLLTLQYGRFLFDLVNQKIFETVRSYVRSDTLGNFVLY